jgi:hypothetical protein
MLGYRTARIVSFVVSRVSGLTVPLLLKYAAPSVILEATLATVFFNESFGSSLP